MVTRLKRYRGSDLVLIEQSLSKGPVMYVKTPLPENWFVVRDALETIRINAYLIDVDNFLFAMFTRANPLDN